MSNEIARISSTGDVNSEIVLISFYGGILRGKRLEVSVGDGFNREVVELTRDQVRQMQSAINDWMG